MLLDDSSSGAASSKEFSEKITTSVSGDVADEKRYSLLVSQARADALMWDFTNNPKVSIRQMDGIEGALLFCTDDRNVWNLMSKKVGNTPKLPDGVIHEARGKGKLEPPAMRSM